MANGGVDHSSSIQSRPAGVRGRRSEGVRYVNGAASPDAPAGSGGGLQNGGGSPRIHENGHSSSSAASASMSDSSSKKVKQPAPSNGEQQIETNDKGHHLHPHHYHRHQDNDPVWVYGIFVLLVYISWVTFPDTINLAGENATVRHVFYYGWLTAMSTGLGILPFYVVKDMNKWWLGVSNATAAGMMLAASTSLVYEGIVLESTQPCIIPQTIRVIIGLVGGLIFIISTKQVLEQHEDLKVAGLDGLEARKVLLLIFVMTLHSFTEGVGIGVSFGGSNGSKLGVFISLSLAVHNVPEGLAVALVLVPKNISKLKTALWTILTSIPQPLMAVPAYLFVESFIPFLPVGLGFAAGAMLWVAFFELVAEAYEDTGSKTVTGGVMAVAFGAMMLLQHLIKEEV